MAAVTEATGTTEIFHDGSKAVTFECRGQRNFGVYAEDGLRLPGISPIEDFIEAVRPGLMWGRASLGPNLYKDPPQNRGLVQGKDVYWWKAGSPRKEERSVEWVLVWGCNTEKECVYYSILNEIRGDEYDENSKILNLRPVDKKVYAVSFRTFQQQVVQWSDKTMPKPLFYSEIGSEYVRQLNEFDYAGVYTDKKKREALRAIGEEINTIGGFGFMQSVCEAMNRKNRGEVGRIWDGIGDWMM